LSIAKEKSDLAIKGTFDDAVKVFFAKGSESAKK